MLNSWPLAKDLQVLVEIVHSGSFSAAAATLGQTPAFVTKRIQILENTLATTLLNRSARGVALTESGQRCYEHALEILTQYQRLVDEMAALYTSTAFKMTAKLLYTGVTNLVLFNPPIAAT